jgi:cohesin complex subunit SCC1
VTAKRKRKLLVDEIKSISGEDMKNQLSDPGDTITSLDIAPPTKKLMHWKETGGVDKLFVLPTHRLSCKDMLRVYTGNLITLYNASTSDDAYDVNIVAPHEDLQLDDGATMGLLPDQQQLMGQRSATPQGTPFSSMLHADPLNLQPHQLPALPATSSSGHNTPQQCPNASNSGASDLGVIPEELTTVVDANTAEANIVGDPDGPLTSSGDVILGAAGLDPPGILPTLSEEGERSTGGAGRLEDDSSRVGGDAVRVSSASSPSGGVQTANEPGGRPSPSVSPSCCDPFSPWIPTEEPPTPFSYFEAPPDNFNDLHQTTPAAVSVSDTAVQQQQQQQEEFLEEETDELADDGNSGSSVSTGLNKRTQKFLNIMKNMGRDEVSFKALTTGNHRKLAAQKFYALLVLKKWRMIDVAQVEPFGDIRVRVGGDEEVTLPSAATATA